jgi:hypothetical protein
MMTGVITRRAWLGLRSCQVRRTAIRCETSCEAAAKPVHKHMHTEAPASSSRSPCCSGLGWAGVGTSRRAGQKRPGPRSPSGALGTRSIPADQGHPCPAGGHRPIRPICLRVGVATGFLIGVSTGSYWLGSSGKRGGTRGGPWAGVGWSRSSRPGSRARSRPARPGPEGRARPTARPGPYARQSRRRPSGGAAEAFVLRDFSLPVRRPVPPSFPGHLGDGSQARQGATHGANDRVPETKQGGRRTVATGITCGRIWTEFAGNRAVRNRVANRR